MRTLRTMLAVALSVLAVAFYAYGPVLTPVMHGSAVSTCNDLAGGNYRSYRLSWVVGTRPHWSCWNASDPARPAVDLGWWVSSS